jgi:plastocyanin
MRARFVLGVIAALVAASCSGSGAEETTVPSNPADDADITIQNFSFGQPLVVDVGANVTVANSDSVPHTWTSEDDVFDSGSLSPGEEFAFTFEQAGEYEFFCKIHPTMTGSVTVEG